MADAARNIDPEPQAVAEAVVQRLARDTAGLRRLVLEEEILLDINEVAELIGVSRKTAVKMAEEQTLPCFWMEEAGGWRITLKAFRSAVRDLEKRGRSKKTLGERQRMLEARREKRRRTLQKKGP